MNKLIIFCLILLPSLSFAETLRGHNSTWQCAAYDDSNKQWIVKSQYQRKAINQAKANCTNDSQNPKSCHVAKEFCEVIVAGREYKSHWQCLALDKMGHHFRSDTHNSRNHAIVGARKLCQRQSVFPSSCYVRLLTCKNKS